MHAAPLSPRLIDIHELCDDEAVNRALSNVARERVPLGASNDLCVRRPEGDAPAVDQLDAQRAVDCVRRSELLCDERRGRDGFALALYHVKDDRNAPGLAGRRDPAQEAQGGHGAGRQPHGKGSPGLPHD
jgi:hypothetical protein